MRLVNDLIPDVFMRKTNLLFVAAVFSCKTSWDSCPSGHSREHKPLHYAMLTCQATNFGMVRGDGWVLIVVRNCQQLHNRQIHPCFLYSVLLIINPLYPCYFILCIIVLFSVSLLLFYPLYPCYSILCILVIFSFVSQKLYSLYPSYSIFCILVVLSSVSLKLYSLYSSYSILCILDSANQTEEDKIYATSPVQFCDLDSLL